MFSLNWNYRNLFKISKDLVLLIRDYAPTVEVFETNAKNLEEDINSSVLHNQLNSPC